MLLMKTQQENKFRTAELIFLPQRRWNNSCRGNCQRRHHPPPVWQNVSYQWQN